MSVESQTQSLQKSTNKVPSTKWIPFILGPLAGALLFLVLPDSLNTLGKLTAGIAIWMAIWWMTEAIPIPITSLIPLALFPLLGISTIPEMGPAYANSVIFLVLGGVLLGLATERWGLHKRIAFHTIKLFGTKPPQIVFGLMVASAVISAWVSNTATAVIMIPIAVSILSLLKDLHAEAVDVKFTAALILGVAYGVTIGSAATLIGAPNVALLKAFLEDQQQPMDFGHWMLFAVPFALVMLVAAWFVLTFLVYKPTVSEIPGGKELISRQLNELGPMSSAEKRISIIFAVAIFCWVFLPFIAGLPAVAEALPWLSKLQDAQIAIIAAMACFVVPSKSPQQTTRPLLQWKDTRDVPWGLLLLFGGGLALSGAFTSTELSVWIGQQVEALSGVPPFIILLVTALIAVGLTELTSNTATAAAFYPIFWAVATGVGMDPLLMTIVVALAVNSAFMLPVATPSNAVAFGSGEITIRQMIKAGVWLNLVALMFIMIAAYTLIPLVFGVSS